MTRHVTLAVLLTATWSSYGSAEIVRYKFSGFTESFIPDVFGEFIPSDTHVTGQFAYDTNSAAEVLSVDDCLECAIYAQDVANGFWAKFGDTLVRATGYSVQISDNFDGVQGLRDIFAVKYTGSADKPLLVNGNAFPDALFEIMFFYESNPMDNGQLPTSLQFDPKYTALDIIDDQVNRLADRPLGVPNVMFHIDHLEAVPEPATGASAYLGALSLILAMACKRRTGRYADRQRSLQQTTL